MTEEDKKEQAAFDADLSPQHEQNKKAAEDHGLRFDRKKGFYVDKEGALVRDHFGQPI